jgi:hypothetical protein
MKSINIYTLEFIHEAGLEIVGSSENPLTAFEVRLSLVRDKQYETFF